MPVNPLQTKMNTLIGPVEFLKPKQWIIDLVGDKWVAPANPKLSGFFDYRSLPQEMKEEFVMNDGNIHEIMFIVQQRIDSISWNDFINVNPKAWMLFGNLMQFFEIANNYEIYEDIVDLDVMNQWLSANEFDVYQVNHDTISQIIDAFDDWDYMWDGMCYAFSTHCSDLEMLRKNINILKWSSLSRNPNAIPILMENQSKINWPSLSANPAAESLLRQNQNRIDWSEAAPNPAINDLILSSTRRNDLGEKICANESDAAMDFLQESPHLLSAELNGNSNPRAIDFLETHQRLISQAWLLSNSAVIDYDYELIRNCKQQLHHDLMQHLYQPLFIEKWIDAGNDIEDYLQ